MSASAPRSLVCGLIGAGIQASLTPAMHEREGAAHGLRYIYQKLDTDQSLRSDATLPQLLAAARWLGFAGLNITYPFKQQVVPLLDELSPEAQALGAVNTVAIRDGRLIGYNTDCSGFAAAFRSGLPDVARERVVQLGAGGAGAAVAQAALDLGVETLHVHDIDAARAAALCARLNQHNGGERAHAITSDALANLLRNADGLIHCTPTGMTKLPGLPLAAELIDAHLWVAEIVYFPLDTELLRLARSRGCRTLDGGGMAVHQAVGAFNHFTGLTADAARMRGHFLELVGISRN